MCRHSILARGVWSCVLTAVWGCWVFSADAQEVKEGDREPAKVSSLPRPAARDLSRRPVTVDQAAQAFDSRFIHRECFAALIVHPSEALKSPSLRLIPTEILEKLAFGSLPFEFSQLREVVFLYGFDSSFEIFTGAICRFEQPYDRAKLLAGLDPPDMPPAAEAPTLYRLPGTEDQGLALPDERTVLLAPLDKLPAMLASQAGVSPLVERLGRAELGGAVAFVGVNWPVQVLPLFMDETFSSEERELAKIFSLCTAAEVRFHLGEEPEMAIVLDCKDAKDVSALNQLLDRGVIWCARFFDAAPPEPGEAGARPFDAAAPFEASVMRYFKRLIEQLASGFECQERDDRLVLIIKGELLASAAFGTMASDYLFDIADFQSFVASEPEEEGKSEENLQRIGKAMLAYHELHEKLPQTSVDRDGKPLLSWRVDLLPFLGEWELYEQFRLNEPWDSEHNLKLADRMPDVFRSDEKDRSSKTCYLAVVGPEAILSPGKEVSLNQLGDHSQTILFVETNASRATIWTKPDDFVFDPADPLAGLGGRHPRGFFALYADGFPNPQGKKCTAVGTHFVFFSMMPDELRALFRPKMSKPAEEPEEE